MAADEAQLTVVAISLHAAGVGKAAVCLCWRQNQARNCVVCVQLWPQLVVYTMLMSDAIEYLQLN